jgi:Holliday junction DNA helicase RuvA
MAKGVGKRLAAQLILALKGKLPSIVPAGTVSGVPTGKVQAEALEALVGLGYTNAEAQAALNKIPADQALTLEQMVTYALRTFSRS